MSNNTAKKTKQKWIIKALCEIVREEFGKNAESVNRYVCVAATGERHLPPDEITIPQIVDGDYGNIVFEDSRDVKKCKNLRRHIDEATREAARMVIRSVVRIYWQNGTLSLFRSSGSVSDRLEYMLLRGKVFDFPLLLPAYTQNWTIRSFRELAAPELDLIRSEKSRYRKDLEKEAARLQEEAAAKYRQIEYDLPFRYFSMEQSPERKEELGILRERYTDREIRLLLHFNRIRMSAPLRAEYALRLKSNLNPDDYHLKPALNLNCTPDTELNLAAQGASILRREFEEAEQARQEAERVIREESERQARLHESVLDHIPDNYIDFFPLARSLKRHFTLHIGPTNSGKTYGAMEALKEAGSGIYLAPLRLLAYEKYEQLNLDGCICSLLTGEERSEMDGALFQASTIEMMDLRKYYDCVVIDEAQMVAEEERGGSWTSAILGACSENIHICAAPIAEEILIRMIEDCGDTWEIVRHKRMTPLICESRPYSLLKDTRKGDALIVFSKRNVHAVASELQHLGIRCSLIYGALPYSVRHEQARLFAEGENEVVVATDAIGMGMNLPIRRVVFLENEKFDGKNQRPLKAEEVKQIAGRAGRFGIYPEGRVTSQGERRMIRANLNAPSDPVTYATIAFPESLLGIDAPLSEIIRKWDEIRINEGYRRADTRRMLELCSIVEQYSDDKMFQYQCITITFDEKIPELLDCWRDICRMEAGGERLPVEAYLPDAASLAFFHDNLDHLEQAFKLCDLLYSFCDKFRRYEYVQDIMATKSNISEKILKLLEEQKLQQRRCKRCGRIMSWNYPYGICDRCFERGHHQGRRR